jgi:hypothetical protein
MKILFQIRFMLLALIAWGAMSFQTSPTSSEPQLQTSNLKLQTLRPWELLGVKKVDYALDRDEVLVTAREGRFTGLKVRVKHSPINLHKIVIHYGNGEVDEIEVRSNIPTGGETRVLDLPGNKRVIQKVVFWYDTKNLARGKALVELWGRH